jgi:MOSC domain-containing protein YiiM
MIVLALHMGVAAEVPLQGSGEWWDKEWRTGFYKQPQQGPRWLGYQGFRGDEVADTRYHGGVDKAVCVYPSEHYAYWHGKEEEMSGAAHGAFGENLTTGGLLEEQACIGDIYSLGEALVQVSQPRQPCWKLARRWRVKDLALQVERTGKTGFYFRVLRHGHVESGDQLTLESRENPQWSIARCNELMHLQKGDIDSARELSSIPELSGSWKDGLWARSQSRGRDAAARRDQPA